MLIVQAVCGWRGGDALAQRRVTRMSGGSVDGSAGGDGGTRPTPPPTGGQRRWHTVEVLEEGESEVERLGVLQAESVLEAREARGAGGLYSCPPSDCHRGECFSCAGRLLEGSTRNFAIHQPGGAESPLPASAEAAGLVLACSMFPTGPGVRVGCGVRRDPPARMVCDARYGGGYSSRAVETPDPPDTRRRTRSFFRRGSARATSTTSGATSTRGSATTRPARRAARAPPRPHARSATTRRRTSPSSSANSNRLSPASTRTRTRMRAQTAAAAALREL